MSAHRVLLQCSGDFEIATNCVDIDLIWSFLTTFCGHYWVQYREVLFMNYMYLKTKGAWSRSKHCPVPRPKAECSFCKVDLLIGRVRRSWFLQCCETEVYCQKQSNAIYLLCYHSNEILWLLFNYFCYECNWQIVVELELESCA